MFALNPGLCRRLALVAAAAALAGGCVIDAPQTPTDDQDVDSKFVRAGEPVAGQYIVVFAAPKDAAARAAMNIPEIADNLSLRYDATIDRTWSHALQGFAARMSELDARELAADPSVEYVQENGVVHVSATQSGATWGLDRLDQRDRPLDSSYTYNNTASNVSAYIIDTGIRITHNDFGGRAHSGHDSVGDGNGTNDCNGHGTHVAGTVGGGTWGVAKSVNLYAVRVLDCNGSGSDQGVIDGVDWVAQNHSGPSVANMSLGGGASPALDDSVRNAITAGVTFALAAGNENANACNGSPSRVTEAITVGASTSSDSRSSFSNWGTCVDIFAPGSGITSAWGSGNSATNTISGTSMASPHVAGAAALYLGANPGASPQQVADALTSNSSTGKLSSIGTGSPNRLLYTAFIGGGGEPPPPPPPPPPPGGKTETVSGSLTQGQFFRPTPGKSVKTGSTFKVVMTGSGDCDLYVRWNARPSTVSYVCRPYTDHANETCELTVPSGATTAFFGVRGYTACSYSATVTWTEP